MPVNNIQFRAEIGIFNSVLHRVIFNKKTCLLQFIINNLNIMSLMKNCDMKLFYSLIIHLLCFFTTCLLFPLVIVISLIFCNVLSLYINFPNLYVYVYIFWRFIINLFLLPVVHHKTFARLLTRYCLFFQISLFLPLIKHALIISGDIETNPGPVNLDNQNLSLCHWNLNGITVNNYIKISLLQAYNAIHDFDIICLSETFFKF